MACLPNYRCNFSPHLRAGVSGNLQRLLSEYRKTERRARALENVVIPEMTHKLHDMSSRLEELDQEDVVRVHMKAFAH